MPQPRLTFFSGTAAAAVFAAIVTWLICKNTLPFYFEVSVDASDQGMAQVYYDKGNGINAEDSASTRLPQGRSIIRLPIPEGEYRALRFDPIDHGYCRFSVERAQIVNVSGSIKREFLPEEFTAYEDMSRREITGDRLAAILSSAESDPSMTTIFVQPLQLYSSLSDYWRLALKTFFISLVAIGVAAGPWLFVMKRRLDRRLLLSCALAAFVCVAARSRLGTPDHLGRGIFIRSGWTVKNGSMPSR